MPNVTPVDVVTDSFLFIPHVLSCRQAK